MKLLRFALAASMLATSFASQAAPLLFNGHYYDYITSGQNFTLDEALADAATRSYGGDAGYVATVTSQDEQDFIHSSVTANTAWIGGHDRASEGTFRWVNGPEAGQAFSFTFWSGAEPNDCCSGEDDAVINWSGGGQWNDIGLPSFPDYRIGYVIEYGGQRQGLPEPGSLALIGFALAGLSAFRRRKA